MDGFESFSSVVIVGAGVCGAAAAEGLRNAGYDGRIVLIGDEPSGPYERPPLSKEYLRGESTEAALLVHDDEWYRDNDIELRSGARVTAVDTSARTVLVDGREFVRFDRLLVAAGGAARRLAECSSPRVHYLRSLDDARRLRAQLGSIRALVVVGAGFIGAEIAATARGLGLDVTLLEALDVPLMRALGRDLGRVYADIHHDAGVNLRTGESVSEVRDHGDSLVVHTTRGAAIECDLVAVGIGLEANVQFLETTAVELNDGVVVDEFCQSSHPAVYAAGDVANHYHPVFGRHLRVEHYDNALRQGALAARNMLGARESYDDPHWFWSDQYTYNLQYVGAPGRWDDLVVRGSIPDRRFAAFFLEGPRVTGAMAINQGKDVMLAKRLIRDSTPVSPERLRDPDVSLREIVRGAPTSA